MRYKINCVAHKRRIILYNAKWHIQYRNILDGSSLIDDVAYHDEWCRIIVFVIDYCAEPSAQLLDALYIVRSICFFTHTSVAKIEKLGLPLKMAYIRFDVGPDILKKEGTYWFIGHSCNISLKYINVNLCKSLQTLKLLDLTKKLWFC